MANPLDICVLSERAIARNEIIVRSRVIGGLQMIDGGEADDKIISVLDNDYVWGRARNISDVPSVLVERLQHYFLTYKLVPGQARRRGLPRCMAGRTRSRSCERRWPTTMTTSGAGLESRDREGGGPRRDGGDDWDSRPVWPAESKSQGLEEL
jgi:hypothetical protein